MNTKPCRERTFPLRLVFDYQHHYALALRWLRHFVERLGREHTLAVWQEAFRNYDETFLLEILGAKWDECPTRNKNMEKELTDFAAELFPVEGVSAVQAREIVDHTPPFQQIQARFPSLDVMREISTYDALHLFRDGLARIAETILDRYGKAGELMIYDVLLEEWPVNEPTPVEKFMAQRKARFSKKPAKMDMHQAGLAVELVRASKQGVVTRVTECEWARYYRERHPRVGYMLACSLDNAAYRSINNRIRLQRTTTLMEGGSECDFRVYALPE